MNKGQLKGYMEFFSFLPNSSLKADPRDLLDAAKRTEIGTFGWPIGLVFTDSKLKPTPYMKDGIGGVKLHFESDDGRFDFWTLNENGDYYILASLFEDIRVPNRIFFDSRTVRTAETFLRTANLYLELGVPPSQEMECRIEYGGLKGRIIAAANPRRIMFEDNVIKVENISRVYKRKISEFADPTILKELVFDTVKSITIMSSDMWVPSKTEVIDPIVDNFLKGRIT